MLIEIEHTSIENIQSILKFAQKLNLKASFIDDTASGDYEKKYTEEELEEIIKKSRETSSIGIDEAHKRIKTLFKWK